MFFNLRPSPAVWEKNGNARKTADNQRYADNDYQEEPETPSQRCINSPPSSTGAVETPKP